MFDIDNEISSFIHVSTDLPEAAAEKDVKAIQLYNEAIGDLRAGNMDIAFIKAKKAISLKPDFYLAKLLVGLYYTKIFEHKKAGVVLDDVVRNSKDYGEDALKYIRLINADADKKHPVFSSERGEDKSGQSKKEKKEIKKPVLIAFWICIGILLCLPFIFSGSGKTDETNETNDHWEIISSQESVIYEYEVIISSLESEISDLEGRIRTLEEELVKETIPETPPPEPTTDELVEELRQKMTEDFTEYLKITELHNENKILEAADRIVLFMDTNTTFTDEPTSLLVKLYSELMDKAARFCEDSGVWFFEQGRYNESLDRLNMTTRYRKDYSRMYRVIYYIGRNLFFLGDYEAAKDKFHEVIRIAPNDDWVGYANLRLDEINDLLNNEE